MQDETQWKRRFGAELSRAANRIEGEAKTGRRLPSLAVVALVGIFMVPAAAIAASQIWNSEPKEPAHSTGIIADHDEALTSDATPESERGEVVGVLCETDEPRKSVASGSPPPEVVESLGLLRDRERQSRALTQMPGPVFQQYARQATSSDGTQFVVAPVSITDVGEIDSNSGGCQDLAHREESRTTMICMALDSSNGGQFCSTVAQLRRGEAFMTEDQVPGDRPGTARVFGMVLDGVAAVDIRFHPDAELRPVRVRVSENVFSHAYNGSAAAPPTITPIGAM